MYRLLMLTVLLILLAACAPATPVSSKPTQAAPQPTQPDATPTGEWTIRMIHSGGIMGLMRVIEVSSDGTFTVVDERASKTVTDKLPATSLAALQGLVTSARFESQPAAPSLCADCFNYDIEISTEGSARPLKVHLDDTTLSKSGMAELVGFLRGLMDEALAE